ncbi:DUF92 domain-containing protein [Fodinibius salsisoli]|uniref:DUF92 domain-containing protein n=1 Tax=Fodinibius salsisoli TaxID=2820877 RepID=A0ABT3PLM6_9BACT|nr:DUF92 domain-containing protein [Fodinibius salsisoli]MCW9706826.1 DUF92 domain-containing protein [Fodinibius salsisoli]
MLFTDRKLNVLFSFIGIFVFVLVGLPNYWNIIWGILLAFLFSLSAFLLHHLTLDGMFAATIVGIFILGIGGWSAALVVLLFFISSSIFSQTELSPGLGISDRSRRDGLQVWANGFWMVFFLMLTAITGDQTFLVAALTAIAVATADTWATELRSEKQGATYLVTIYEQVPPGTDGAISLQGTIWSLLGSSLIAGASIYVFSLQLSIFFCIFIAGFLGGLLDSYLGATFQQNSKPAVVPGTRHYLNIDNNMVNALSTGAGALLAIILNLIFI